MPAVGVSELQIRGSIEDNSKTIFLISQPLNRVVLMMGHNICLKGVLGKIIPKISCLPLLIWSTGICFKVHGYTSKADKLDLAIPQVPLPTLL